jgi:dihydrofolate reductase
MLNIILAIDKNYGIGKNGKLPWYIKEDLQIFKNIQIIHIISIFI